MACLVSRAVAIYSRAHVPHPARGIVPLRECCMKKAPSNFKSVMTNDGEFRGYLSGTIELTSTPSHS